MFMTLCISSNKCCRRGGGSVTYLTAIVILLWILRYWEQEWKTGMRMEICSLYVYIKIIN